MGVTITESAAREIHSIIKKQELDLDKIRLRVAVKGGGCSGFSYLLDLTENERDSDEVYESRYPIQSKTAAVAVAESGGDNGDSFTLRVICDPKSYLYLNGTTIDFKDELMGRGFVFSNPNASSTCGCGSSFAV